MQVKRLTALTICGLAFSLFGMTTALRAESNQAGSRQAVLHISVAVMPVVQALNIAPSLPQNGPVTYSLDTTPREKTYEVRPLPPETTAHADQQAPAILKTLVVVAE